MPTTTTLGIKTDGAHLTVLPFFYKMNTEQVALVERIRPAMHTDSADRCHPRGVQLTHPLLLPELTMRLASPGVGVSPVGALRLKWSPRLPRTAPVFVHGLGAHLDPSEPELREPCGLYPIDGVRHQDLDSRDRSPTPQECNVRPNRIRPVLHLDVVPEKAPRLDALGFTGRGSRPAVVGATKPEPHIVRLRPDRAQCLSQGEFGVQVKCTLRRRGRTPGSIRLVPVVVHVVQPEREVHSAQAPAAGRVFAHGAAELFRHWPHAVQTERSSPRLLRRYQTRLANGIDVSSVVVSESCILGGRQGALEEERPAGLFRMLRQRTSDSKKAGPQR